MQSQQKRVKWSRGETAEALEERTDTGITMVSVERMENCIPDIYGNISRRPGLKVLPCSLNSYGFEYDEHLQVFPFYLTEQDIILVGVHFNSRTELIRVKDNVVVHQATVGAGSSYPKTGVDLGLIGGVYSYRPVSFAQQNNYMLIADGYNVYKLQIEVSTIDDSFTPTMEVWKFSAGWYAPNGTNTTQITSTEVPGMNFNSSSVGSYTYTETNGETTVYSWIDTGISSGAITATWTGATTIYYMRADYTISTTPGSNPVASWTMTNGSSYSDGQQLVASFSYYGFPYPINFKIAGGRVFFYAPTMNPISLDVTDQASIIAPNIINYIPIGCIVQFPNNGSHMRVEGYDSDGSHLRMYGSLLTPIADNNAHDDRVAIETGYVSLTPDKWNNVQSFPHPKKLVFNDQRLWAGAWSYSVKEEYAIVLGSQIARYNDLKNDYNQENEPITLDILTQFKERILHLIDYNGLKIMTDSFEYAYQDGGVVKQSANGSFEYCEPIVFDSLCLYVDTTGCQVKAMQYEFQSNIFNSTTINQVAPHDLVWYPMSMAAYEDKTNSTGKYLFLVNRDDANARMAVCNFVPGNQANIWNRWTFPMVNLGSGYDNKSVSLLHSVVQTKNHPIFMLTFNKFSGGVPGSYANCYIVPAVIDFAINTDTDSAVYTAGGVNYYAPFKHETSPFSRLTIPNATVAVYANGVFQFMDTTTSTGALTKSLEGLTNVTVGLPINAMVVSHPIDVGGKTKSIKKRIGKAQMSVHDTDAGAIVINGKTGYMNPAKDHISFYGVTGMKNEIKYTLTNNNGAAFHLESLLMNIEYGTLDS